jgi:hypothetical protein
MKWDNRRYIEAAVEFFANADLFLRLTWHLPYNPLSSNYRTNSDALTTYDVIGFGFTVTAIPCSAEMSESVALSSGLRELWP